MVQSMTGFGKAEGNIGNKKFNVEIRSVNSKQFDLNVRMPALYKEKEIPMRNALSKSLQRGKIDLAIYYDSNGEEVKHKINPTVVSAYYEQLKSVMIDLGQEPENAWEAILKMPDVLSSDKKELDEEEWAGVQQLINQAAERFTEFRSQEGKILEDDFRKRIAMIGNYAQEVVPFETERANDVREKIINHLQEYNEAEQIDQNRFEQELIYYLEKLDITEERVRLENHLNYFIETLDQPNSQGKKLGFICQEIGREINTMGSKANHATIQKLVVQMKDELEKIKEQVLNVL